MLEIDGNHLSLADVAAVARGGAPVKLAEAGAAAVQVSRARLLDLSQGSKPVYGVNTGFGLFCDRKIDNGDAVHLSRNLILSHAVGTGDPLPTEIVRAAMLVRANALAKGFSGVRREIIDCLLEMLNRKLTPSVPEQGSLGSSGDLCPLSHLALVFTTDVRDREEDSGQAVFEGKIMSGKQAMEKAGLQRLILGAKEGLAVNNGATFSAAIGALAVLDALHLLDIADLCAAMTLEALLGCPEAFDPRIHAVRPHPGQARCAAGIRALTEDSTLVGADGRVQDAYSLRCAPQVHGSAREAVDYVRQVIERELNAATDNPLLFEGGATLSGGNFHGEPVGMAMDFLGIAVAELASISERRLYRLLDDKLNAGLPPMLVGTPENAGLNSGLMMLQYTAAALVLENQRLASPDSVLSLPTSGGQEDHNANSMSAARKARQIVKNTTQVLALELCAAVRALELRLRQRPMANLGKGTGEVYSALLQQLTFTDNDSWWSPEIEKVRRFIEDDKLPLSCLVEANRV
ncbi:MAG: histidine ammonia-lyase [Anaerolineaceae bacterium]|nr:histidine ammonia-lyase [Anaerolineaceae bacterium]